MNDHDLLFYAAKAMQASGNVKFTNYDVANGTVYLELGTRRGQITSYWNPLDWNGDAFSLAVQLRISLLLAETPPKHPECGYGVALMDGPLWRYVTASNDDPSAATRRAITMAAAEIGKEYANE